MNQGEKGRIWRAPLYLPYLQPTLTDEIIGEAEKKIGHKLPIEYLQQLRIQNGGYLRYTIKGTPHSCMSGIGPNYPSITAFEWLQDFKGALSYDIDDLYPFDGDGHWNLCLDYRQNRTEAAVTYIDTESDHERPVAQNFKEYLGKLMLDNWDSHVIKTEAGIEWVTTQVSRIAGIRFGELHPIEPGYPLYYGTYNGSGVWISPNKVPKGFIRPGEDRYDELAPQMKLSALMHPEIPESYMVLDVREDAEQSKLIEVLSNNGLVLSPIKEFF